MNKVIVDDVTRKKLGDLTEPVVLCDESGKVFARVFPDAALSGYEKWVPPMDDKELRRRAQSNDWITTQELLDGLEEA